MFNSMRGITFDQVRTFSEVSERASFSVAGNHPWLSQPAVSQQIRLLEKL
jgi:DNA-binding transcriptional LysR family regulator